MEKTSVIITIMLLSASLMSAQDQLYKKNEHKVGQVAEGAAKKRANNDQKMQDFYKEVITKAFDEYWKSPASRSKYDTGSKALFSDKIKELKRQKKVNSKSLKALEGSSGKEDKEAQKIAKDIKFQEERIAKALKAKEDINNEIESLQSTYNNKLKPQLDKINQEEGKMKDVKEKYQNTVDNIMELTMPAKLLDKDGWRGVESVLNSFEKERSAMQRVAPELEEKASKQAAKLYQYKKLADCLEKAVTQMSQKYDGKKNQALIASINSYQTEKGLSLSRDQKAECGAIVFALSNQEKTHAFIKEFLESIPKEFGVISDRNMMDEFIQWKSEKLTESKYDTNYKNDYYTRFNEVIGKLDSMRLSQTQEQLNNIIQGYINDL